MKKSIYLLAAAALMTACAGNQQGYTLTGSVENAADGDTVYLAVPEGRKLVNIDSTTIQNGQFTFKGQQDSAIFAALTYRAADKKELSLKFFLENGKTQVYLSSSDDRVSGTPANDLYTPYREASNTVSKYMEQIMELMSDTTLTKEQMEEKKASLFKEYESADQALDSVRNEVMKQNIGNAIGAELLKSNYYAMSTEELDELLPQLAPSYQQDERIIQITEQVAKAKLTAVGKQFTDFAMQTPEGKEVKLSDYVGKGKVVLIDFWASWCGPCRREMPNLVEAYKQYKGKNFEIVGVSLDKDGEAWKAAIKSLNITWPQMSDLKYWQCEGAQLYAVSSIPHTVLVDGEGVIIARGLHGEELQQKLAEVLGK